VQRKFVSVLTQQSNGTYSTVSRLRETVRDSRPVTIAAGGSLFPLPTKEPSDFVMVLRNAAGAELNKLKLHRSRGQPDEVARAEHRAPGSTR
jgi:uncharacterized protein YfaS (alpha-2-macroglobulin family)